MFRLRVRYRNYFIYYMIELDSIHQRFVASTVFEGPWNGGVFSEFDAYLDKVLHSDDKRFRVALKIFIDGFQ